jgi:hypothetical protein
MLEEDPLYPECGDQFIGIRVLKDDITAEITIEFYCDGAGEDIFSFQILRWTNRCRYCRINENRENDTKRNVIKPRGTQI